MSSFKVNTNFSTPRNQGESDFDGDCNRTPTRRLDDPRQYIDNLIGKARHTEPKQTKVCMLIYIIKTQKI
jgi:hypothetical protein